MKTKLNASALKLISCSLLLFTSAAAVAQPDYKNIARIDPNDVPPGSENWLAAFSVDQFETRDPAPKEVDLTDAAKVTMTFKAKSLGLDIGRVFVSLDITDDSYRMTYKVETEGVFRWLDQSEQDVESWGLVSDNQMTSLYYYRDEREPDYEQLVELTRSAPGERFRYWTAPKIKLVHPVVPEIGLGTVDPLGALALLGYTKEKAGDHPCDRHVPSYDGRRRFDMRMEPAGTRTFKNRSKKRYEGFTYKCKVFMDKVAGYNEKNMKADFEGDAFVYLAPLPEEIRSDNLYYIPVYIEGKQGVLGAHAEAKSPTVTLSDGTVIKMGRK